jgi:hypothetical protein
VYDIELTSNNSPSVGPMGRSAYSGRNWEGFSPDPYLSGVTMEKSIRGLQDAGVQATAKHWLLNEQEILRNPVSYPNGTLQYEALSSNVDDRTVRKCSSCGVFGFAGPTVCVRVSLIRRSCERFMSVETTASGNQHLNGRTNCMECTVCYAYTNKTRSSCLRPSDR